MRVTDEQLETLRRFLVHEEGTSRSTLAFAATSHKERDALRAAIEALSHAAGQEVVACYGLRRKGETGVIGLIPEKVHKVKPTSEEFLRDYEEVPLYFHPAVARSEGE